MQTEVIQGTRAFREFEKAFNHFFGECERGFTNELIKFIDEMQAKNDVYFVTESQVISWMQAPKETNAIRDFDDWKLKCEVKGLPECSIPNACLLTTR